MVKKILSKKNLSLISLTFLALALILLSGLFFKGDYHRCIKINTLMCITSKKYQAKDKTYSFRYPSDYPLSAADWASIESQNIAAAKENPPSPTIYEDLNFSTEYYRNAGGDRLGFLTVEKNNLSNIEDYKNQEMNYYRKLSQQWKKEYSIQEPSFVNLTIGNEEAIMLSIDPGSHSLNPPQLKYIYFHNGLMYDLNFFYNSYYHKFPMERYIQGRKIIISTFKFNR